MAPATLTIVCVHELLNPVGTVQGSALAASFRTLVNLNFIGVPRYYRNVDKWRDLGVTYGNSTEFDASIEIFEAIEVATTPAIDKWDARSSAIVIVPSLVVAIFAGPHLSRKAANSLVGERRLIGGRDDLFPMQTEGLALSSRTEPIAVAFTPTIHEVTAGTSMGVVVPLPKRAGTWARVIW